MPAEKDQWVASIIESSSVVLEKETALEDCYRDVRSIHPLRDISDYVRPANQCCHSGPQLFFSIARCRRSRGNDIFGFFKLPLCMSAMQEVSCNLEGPEAALTISLSELGHASTESLEVTILDDLNEQVEAMHVQATQAKSVDGMGADSEPGMVVRRRGHRDDITEKKKTSGNGFAAEKETLPVKIKVTGRDRDNQILKQFGVALPNGDLRQVVLYANRLSTCLVEVATARALLQDQLDRLE